MGEKTAVIVEDDFLIAEHFRQLCGKAGVTVLGAADRADKALKLIRQTKPQYILMDVRLKGEEDGVDVANVVHRELPATKVIFITGSNEPPMLDRIMSDHPYRVLIKPINPDDLNQALS